ncbi:MAG: nicotinate-nucleotide adenylyltransferase [Spirochaetota bacterium]|nr:nicotinate-nucleotide adenylyltransferase [Spirochaetota bacterium]
MKLGIFGGTFNPIHNGHLINAQAIKEEHYLNKIIFLPTKDPVHKSLENITSTDDRFEMVRLSIEDTCGFDVSRMEIDRKSKSYTITTLKQLMKKYKDDRLYLIIGSDAFEQIDTWKDYQKVMQMVELIIMKRPGFTYNKESIYNIAGNVMISNNPYIEISSSDIRKRIREGKSIRYLVPPKVEEYIVKRGLYRN